jgi:hypothetical protein
LMSVRIVSIKGVAIAMAPSYGVAYVPLSERKLGVGMRTLIAVSVPLPQGSFWGQRDLWFGPAKMFHVRDSGEDMRASATNLLTSW